MAHWPISSIVDESKAAIDSYPSVVAALPPSLSASFLPLHFFFFFLTSVEARDVFLWQSLARLGDRIREIRLVTRLPTDGSEWIDDGGEWAEPAKGSDSPNHFEIYDRNA
ncbi:hypothetical protein GW17_00055656 [Ensete ventricosum]|nr:hypothetical protein GW17_00055656 [Ensete ventricosum]